MRSALKTAGVMAGMGAFFAVLLWQPVITGVITGTSIVAITLWIMFEYPMASWPPPRPREED